MRFIGATSTPAGKRSSAGDIASLGPVLEVSSIGIWGWVCSVLTAPSTLTVSGAGARETQAGFGRGDSVRGADSSPASMRLTADGQPRRPAEGQEPGPGGTGRKCLSFSSEVPGRGASAPGAGEVVDRTEAGRTEKAGAL